MTAVVSWFYDLTRRGFVRTQMPSPSPGTPSPPLPPALVREVADGATLAGRYQLLGEIGKGAMGRVLSARDAKLERRVAVKVITGAHDPTRVQRFVQEARTAGGLEHPNVLAVYDLGEHDGAPFLVTELLEGRTLRTLLRDGPLPVPQVLNLASQLAHGLAAAHARGIVHRDLKPENLFVTDDGRLKILDFGLARLTSEEAAPGLTQTGAVFGTPGYLSPEQARGEKVGPASDVFSAGAVIHEMLSGQRAFPGASLIEAGHAALTAEPAALPLRTPPALEAVLSRALRKEPAKRFADGGELSKALDAISTTSSVALPGRPRRRSTALMVGLAALAVLAAFVSGVRVSHSARNRARASPRLAVPEFPATPTPPAGLRAAPPASSPAASDDEDDADDANPQRIADNVQNALRKSLPRAGRMGLLVGVRSLVASGRADHAEALLRKQRDPIAHLELYLLRRNTGHPEEAKTELAAWMKAHPSHAWPEPLLRAYTEGLSDDTVLAAAQDDPDDLCEARYYLGRLHEKSDAARARSELQAAASGKCDEAEQAREALSGQ